MKTDIEIAQKAKLKPIVSVAKKLGISRKYLELYGDYKAKISLDILNKINHNKKGKYIDVTAITPTPLGEGKTVTTIGLAMALNRIGKETACCIRQPSLGPVFGIKGGAAGGGNSQVVPMEEFNLHLTGDVHAIGLANNLCAAFLDNHIFRKNKLNIDLNKIFWRRVVDVSDRSLRHIRIGIGGDEYGVERDTRGHGGTCAHGFHLGPEEEDVEDRCSAHKGRTARNLRRSESRRRHDGPFERRHKT